MKQESIIQEMDANEKVYNSINIKEMDYEDSTFYYPCPCGDLFELPLPSLIQGQRIATCLSCSLQIEVIVTQNDLETICRCYNIDVAGSSSHRSIIEAAQP